LLLQTYHAQFCIEGGFGAIWAAFSHWRGNFFAGKLFVAVEGWGDRVVRKIFAKRPLRQRIVALVAAYAMAFAGLIASFVGAQAAAEAAAQSGVIICHSSLGADSAPASQDSNDNFCVKSCVGCITSLAMAIPPTVSAIRMLQSASKRLDLPVRLGCLDNAKANAHRSRGPPPVL